MKSNLKQHSGECKTDRARGQKYFKGRVYARERMFPYVVWDGRHAYESAPPPNLWVAENLTGTTLIAQVRNPKLGTENVTALLEACDSLIIWTFNTAVYHSIVENIKRQSNGGWLS